jgi:hypothetical protein
VPRPTRGPLCTLTRTGLSPSLARRSRRFRFVHKGHWPGPRSLATTCGVAPPAPKGRKIMLLSFPPATEMVQFAGFAARGYGFTARYPKKGWVAPFGHPRITGRSPLPSAFRSVPRPSSPLGTKASTRCPFRAAFAPSPEHAAAAQAAADVRRQMSDVRRHRARPAGQRSLNRPIPQTISRSSRPRTRAPTAAPPMLAHRHAYPCSRPDLIPTRMMAGPASHGHDSLHDIHRTEDGDQRTDHPVRRARSPSQLAVPMPADAPGTCSPLAAVSAAELTRLVVGTPGGGPGPI